MADQDLQVSDIPEDYADAELVDGSVDQLVDADQLVDTSDEEENDDSDDELISDENENEDSESGEDNDDGDAEDDTNDLVDDSNDVIEGSSAAVENNAHGIDTDANHVEGFNYGNNEQLGTNAAFDVDESNAVEGDHSVNGATKERKRKRLTQRKLTKKKKRSKNGVDENGVATNGAAEISTSESDNETDVVDKTTKKRRQKKGDKTSKPRRQKKKKSNKPVSMRRNIRTLIGEENLTETTKEARAEEAERLRRLMMTHQFPEPRPSLEENSQQVFQDESKSSQVIHLSSSEEEEEADLASADVQLSSCPPVPCDDSDSDVKILSDDQACEPEEELEEDPERLGLHVDDRLNVAEEDGKIIVNKGHPPQDEDIHLAPQFQGVIKPHQIGGVRFLFDNIIESPSRFDSSNGFGCILAHSMGLGKTLQLVSFTDIFLRHTSGKRVLCIVPINTIQNWMAEYNRWTPAAEDLDPSVDRTRVRPRNFELHLLNDSLKNLEQRAKVIMNWKNVGGVLLMGYELYRLLATRTQRKKRKTKKVATGPLCIDIEEEDKEKLLLEEIQKLLVNPGPDLVICDEGHRIKNAHASTSQALKAIRTKRRVVLTGYPLQNNLIEYWCMVDFVRPNYLGTRTEFSNMFERPIQNGQCIDSTPRDVRLMMHRVHVLHQQLQGFVQRRGHQVLRMSLPPKREYVLLIRMTPYQRKLYRLFMEELISQRSVSNPLRAFAICCKIWNHPDVLYNFVRAKEEAEDLDLEWEEVSNGAGKIPVTPTGQPRPGKMSPKKKLPAQTQPVQQPPQPFPEPTFDPESSNSTSFVNAGPGFSPFATPLKRDEMSYDWTSGCFTEYIEGQTENSHKLELFLDILDETVLVGDRLLLFSQSLFTLSLIEDFLKRRQIPDSGNFWCPGVNYFRLDGSTPAQERERLINAFNADFSVKLFLVSTRAGSLGINLVGANRVIIFDASWNPCHDSQAVCRVYRYGQIKISHIYRFVTDNSLEKKIYDRQVNKQGMADRIVDDSNPDARLSSKDIQKLICDNENDPPPNSWDVESSLQHLIQADPVLARVVHRRPECLSQEPFTHESLLVDRKEKKLSRAEKRMALENFEMERSAKISYTRPSYAAFYPKPQGSTVIGAKDLNLMPSSLASRQQTDSFQGEQSRYYDSSPSPWASKGYASLPAGPSTSSALRKVLENRIMSHNQNQLQYQRSNQMYSQPSRDHPVYPPPQPGRSGHSGPPPVQQPLPAYIHNKQSESNSGSDTPSRFPYEALMRAKDVIIQESTLDNDMTIPTNTGDPPTITLKKGQQVMIIRTPKGMYLRVGEKIIKIKLSAAMMANLKSSAKAGPVPEEQVVTIDSSSDSEETNNQNGGGANLVADNMFPENSPQTHYEQAQMSGQYEASESQNQFVQNYQHQQEDPGLYDGTIPILNDLHHF